MTFMKERKIGLILHSVPCHAVAAKTDY